MRLKEYKRNKFERKYTSKDIQLLAQTAEWHDYPNGAALKKTLERMANTYEEEEYRNIAAISVSHIYNLKKTVSYQRSVTFYQETKKTKGRAIGERCKPEPGGKPGYLRVDTLLHQGDRDGEKGMGKVLDIYKGFTMSIQLMRSCNGRWQEQQQRSQKNISFLCWKR